MTTAWPTCSTLFGNLLLRNERLYEKVIFFSCKRGRNYNVFDRQPMSVMYRRLHSCSKQVFNINPRQYCQKVQVQAVLKCAQMEAKVMRYSWNMQQVCCYCQGSEKTQFHKELKNNLLIKDVLRLKRQQLKEKEQKLRKSGQNLLQDFKDTKELMRERMESVIEKENIWTVPNVLCVSRIIASPVLGYFVIQGNFPMALALFGFAGVTDLLDGWIARNVKNQSSKLGSFLDPMADKILIGVLFTTLTVAGHVPLALTALIIARDVVLVGAGFYIRYQSLPPPRTLERYFNGTLVTAELEPTLISKINTAVQLLYLASVMVAPIWSVPSPEVLFMFSCVTAATTFASGLSYVLKKDTYKIFTEKEK